MRFSAGSGRIAPPVRGGAGRILSGNRRAGRLPGAILTCNRGGIYPEPVAAPALELAVLPAARGTDGAGSGGPRRGGKPGGIADGAAAPAPNPLGRGEPAGGAGRGGDQ